MSRSQKTYWQQQILAVAICLNLAYGIASAKCPGCPAGTAGTGVRPFGYLVLYNIMFVVPLAFVTASAAYFAESQRVAQAYFRYIGVCKLLTALFFFFLSA